MKSTSVALLTNMGLVVLELYWDHAPKSCENICTLADQGYFEGILFHRVVKNFMIQTGDPTGTGRGGNSCWGEKFEDEITKELKHTGAGILSMANSGPNSNGSQFFITLAPAPWLDGKHSIFGRVRYGMQVVQKIGLVPTDKHDKPLQPVSILKAFSFEGDKPDPKLVSLDLVNA